MHLTLTRTESSDQGTFGILAGNGLFLHSAELPWRGNSPRASCIPAGRYQCRPYSSAKFPDVYEAVNVPDRSAILIHAGNYAGDAAKGWKSDVEGCILVGLARGILDNQMALISSRIAMDRLRAAIGRNSFVLVITDKKGVA